MTGTTNLNKVGLGFPQPSREARILAGHVVRVVHAQAKKILHWDINSFRNS
jgi:hypothetical protein